MKEEKLENSQKMLIGISAVAVVAVVSLMMYFFRASDPAANGPIPYKKFDYGTHMEQQTRELNRQPMPSAGQTVRPNRPNP